MLSIVGGGMYLATLKDLNEILTMYQNLTITIVNHQRIQVQRIRGLLQEIGLKKQQIKTSETALKGIIEGKSLAPQLIFFYIDNLDKQPLTTLLLQSNMYVVGIVEAHVQDQIPGLLQAGFQDCLLVEQLNRYQLEKILILFKKHLVKTHDDVQYHTLYKNIFHVSPVPMLVLEPTTLHLMALNQYATEQLGYQPDELNFPISTLCSPQEFSTIQHNVVTLIQGQTPTLAYGKFFKKNGEAIHLEYSLSLVFFEETQVILLVAKDVTDYKRASENEKKSLVQLKAIFEQTQEAIILFNDEGAITQVNSSACKLLQLSAAQIQGQTVAKFLEKVQDEHFQQFWKVFLEGKKNKGITTFVRADGKKILVNFKFKRNLVEGLHMGAFSDITDSYQQQKLTSNLNELYRLLSRTIEYNQFINKALDLVCNVTGFEMAQLWVLDAAKQKLKNVCVGHKKGSPKHQVPLYDIALSDTDVLEVKTLQTQQEQQGVRIKYTIHQEAFVCHSHLIPLKSRNEVVAVLAFCATQAIELSKSQQVFCKNATEVLGLKIAKINIIQELDKVFHHSNGLICTITKQGYFTKVNPMVCHILGLSEQQIQGKPFSQFLHEDEIGICHYLSNLVESKNQSLEFSCRLISKSKVCHWIEWSAVYDPHAECVYLTGKDITEEKISQKKYLQEAENNAVILSSIKDGYFIVRKNGEVKYWNKAATEMFELCPKRPQPLLFWDVLQAQPGSTFFKIHQKYLGKVQEQYFTVYHESKQKWYAVSYYPIEDDMAISYRDITQLKVQEQEIETMKVNLESLIDNTDDYIWSVDKNLCLLTANSPYLNRMYASIGKRPVVGESVLYPVMPKEWNRQFKQHYKKALTGQAFTIVEQWFNPLKNTHEILEISFYPIYRNHQRIGVACFSKNISESVKHLQAIESQNHRLREIAWLQSHKVRGPLSRIMGLVGLVGNGLEEAIPMNQLLQHINESALELDGVIHEIVKKAEKWNIQ